MQRERHGWPRSAWLPLAIFIVASCAAIALAAPGPTRRPVQQQRPAPQPRTAAPVQTATAPRASTPIKSTAGEAQWIWHASFPKDEVPAGTCYFRHVFDIEFPERGHIEITCDNRFELWVNGRRVGSSTDWHVLQVYEIDKQLVRGRNVIAVKCENETKGTAGLAARVVIRQSGGT